jgi:hypothetical protein
MLLNPTNTAWLGRCIVSIWLLSFAMPSFGASSYGFWVFQTADDASLLYGYQCFLYALSLPLIALSQAAFFDATAAFVALIPTFNILKFFFDKLAGRERQQLFAVKTVIINIFAGTYWFFWVHKYSLVGPKFGFYVWLAATVAFNSLLHVQSFTSSNSQNNQNA